MRRILSSLFICAAIFSFDALAADKSENPERDALEMSLDENLNAPSIPAKAGAYVRTAVDQLRRRLVKDGMTNASVSREGEVLELTISCADLFGPMSAELKPSAAEKLRPLGVVVREPAKYKVLVAVHSDDTGDEVYADSITAARANAIDDYLWQLAGQIETNVIPYGIGKDEPLVPNNSRSNRNTNRRVEIFVVPDEGLLQMAGVKRK